MNFRYSGLLVLTMIFVVLMASGCGTADNENNPAADGSQGSADMLDIRGSDTMVNMGAALAEEYMSKHTDVDLIVQGGGSGTGIAAVLNDNADIAQMSRSMRDEEWEEAEENDIDIEEIAVAKDAIAVVVHPDNPVEQLTLEELSAIYRGEIDNWAEVGGKDEEITLVSRDTTSGTFVFFRDAVVRLDGQYPDAEYCENAMFAPSTQAIVDETAQNTSAIGYVGLGYLSEDIKEVALNIEGTPVKPSEAATAEVSYPLSRPLFFYVTGDNTDDSLVGDYLNFVLSDEGQKVVEQLDFLPLSE